MDVLSLESLRLGLQYESLREVADESTQRGMWDPDSVENSDTTKIPQESAKK